MSIAANYSAQKAVVDGIEIVRLADAARHAEVAIAPSLGNLAYAIALPPSIPWAVLPIMIYGVGFAMAMPSVSLITLDLFPTRRGMAASLQGFVSGMVNTLTAGIIAPAATGYARFRLPPRGR